MAESRLKIPPRIKVLRAPLKCSRLELIPISSRDADEFFCAVHESRAALLPWLPWVHLNNTPEDSLRYTQAAERDWDAHAAARFFVRLSANQRLVGVVSLENCSAIHRACQLGYWLHTTAWGQGLITEAAVRVLEFAFLEMNANRVSCAAGTQNTRSLRVIERLGFHFEGVARQAEWVQDRYIDHAVFSLLRSEWRMAEPAQRLG